MTAEDLHFQDEFFDAVVSNCGIGVPEFRKALKEVLKPRKALDSNPLAFARNYS
jgi:ubiquinone/menaquinone biosynthesis C-methylase UbiE